MANESTRLSTADLRRRLTTAPSAPLIFPDDPSVPTALPIHQRSGSSARPSISAELLAQGFVDSSDEFETSAELEDEFGSSQPTPLPPAQASSRKLKRPALQTPAALRPPVTMADTDDFAGLDDGEEMLRLRDENKRYGDMLEEMRQLLLEASDQQERFQTELNTVTAENTAAKARIEELEAIVNTKRTGGVGRRTRARGLPAQPGKEIAQRRPPAAPGGRNVPGATNAADGGWHGPRTRDARPPGDRTQTAQFRGPAGN